MKVLITGGAGFIGSNFVKYMLKAHPDYKLVNLDLLTYAGNLENLRDIEDNPNYEFVHGDIADPTVVKRVVSQGVDAIVNIAAESFVDRSIEGPAVFVRTNVLGTQVLLEAAREFSVQRYVQISTDEVYGSLGPTGLFTEETLLAPSNPYSACKAGGDALVGAYLHTYGLPAVITRCSNNYGPFQYPEKLIPLFVMNALQDKALPVYGDGLHVRDWIYVEDHCTAIDLVLHKGRPGEVYNIGGNNEMKNIEITKLILQRLSKPESLITFVKDRPGHDRRYGIDSSKIQSELDWKPAHTSEEGIAKTIDWYVENQAWCTTLIQRQKEREGNR